MPLILSRIQRFILSLIWYVHPPVNLLVDLPPERIVEKLGTAAKPSQERLHLQDVFVSGRRYRMETRTNGFVMFTNSKSYWRYVEGFMRVGRRTRSTARLIGLMTELDAGYTHIELHAHIRIGYIIDILWIPLFITSIIIFMPWHPITIALLIVTLFTLSYLYHYFNTAYQANEMTFFVEKALQDDLVTDLPALMGAAPDVLSTHEAFEAEWERFYSTHQSDDAPTP